MGSYLTIVNNTPNEWQCKVGADMKALQIAGIVTTVLGTVATIIGTAGAAAPFIATAAGSGVISIMGIKTSVLVAITGAAASAVGSIEIVNSASTFGVTMAGHINDVLVDQGYVRIKSGDKHRFGRMTLSLWQQGTCTRALIVDERTVRTETVNMRPIFSGPTHNSNRDHDIQYWINKGHIERQDIVAQGAPTTNTPTITPASRVLTVRLVSNVTVQGQEDVECDQ